MNQNLKDILESVNFIKDRMLTKDDVREVVREELQPLESKVAGIDKRLDIDAVKRDHEKIPPRVADLENKVFGKSRAPQTPAL